MTTVQRRPKSVATQQNKNQNKNYQKSHKLLKRQQGAGKLAVNGCGQPRRLQNQKFGNIQAHQQTNYPAPTGCESVHNAGHRPKQKNKQIPGRVVPVEIMD